MAIALHSSFAVHPGAWLRAELVLARMESESGYA